MRSYGPCKKCGKILGLAPKPSPSEQAAKSVEAARKALEKPAPGVGEHPVTHREVAIRMQVEYTHGKTDPRERSLDEILALLELLRREQISVYQMLDRSSAIMRSLFRFRWVAIGLRNPSDGMYRYEVMSGFREDAASARRRQAFKPEDFTSNKVYKGWDISPLSKMYFGEDKPYTDGSEVTFNRPILMTSIRRAQDDSLEADYLTVRIPGNKDEMLGWIETSGTITGKLPDIETIKWIELIAQVLGAAVMKRRYLVT